MLSENSRPGPYEDEFDVDFRAQQRPSSERAFLSRKLELPGKRKKANQARYRRGGKAAFFNGSHRRRNKRTQP